MSTPQPVSVKIEPEIRDRIGRLAKAQHRLSHDLMRDAITQYVECEEKREALRQDALRAWTAYQETGQHLPQAQADEWLAQLEAGQDVEPPACQS